MPDSLRHVSTVIGEYPVVTVVDANGTAAASGVLVGDQILSVNGVEPRDLIEWHSLTAQYPVDLQVLRDGQVLEIEVGLTKNDDAMRPFGVEVNSAVFDRVQTCDNHCEFCFIYQLPKGMRKSLYLKDDDYRLSFLYGNFTTLTRFTEADLERVVEQKLSPLYVSIHATDPHVRSQMLRNQRGGMSLRWIRQLLNHGIDVRAQIVLCPSVNDDDVLEDTLATLLEEMPEITSIAVVPLGLSKHNTEKRMRVHTKVEAEKVIECVNRWKQRFSECVSREVVQAADELYLIAETDLPEAVSYGEWEMLEDGIGIARRFIDTFHNSVDDSDLFVETGRHDGFFSSVDHSSGVDDVLNPSAYVRALNPAMDTGLRSQFDTRSTSGVESPEAVPIQLGQKRPVASSVGIVTGSYGARVIGRLVEQYPKDLVHVHEVDNQYFGGNTAVAGLMTFSDIERTLKHAPQDRVYVLPDVCLNNGRFLDGKMIGDLTETHNIRVIPATGSALRDFIERSIQDFHRSDDTMADVNG
jgi:putative radical SAM enzyme (TIGR03279 family)